MGGGVSFGIRVVVCCCIAEVRADWVDPVWVDLGFWAGTLWQMVAMRPYAQWANMLPRVIPSHTLLTVAFLARTGAGQAAGSGEDETAAEEDRQAATAAAMRRMREEACVQHEDDLIVGAAERVGRQLAQLLEAAGRHGAAAVSYLPADAAVEFRGPIGERFGKLRNIDGAGVAELWQPLDARPLLLRLQFGCGICLMDWCREHRSGSQTLAAVNEIGHRVAAADSSIACPAGWTCEYRSAGADAGAPSDQTADEGAASFAYRNTATARVSESSYDFREQQAEPPAGWGGLGSTEGKDAASAAAAAAAADRWEPGEIVEPAPPPPPAAARDAAEAEERTQADYSSGYVAGYSAASLAYESNLQN